MINLRFDPNAGPILCAMCDDLLKLLYDYHMRTLDTAAMNLVATGVKSKGPQLDTAHAVIDAINNERSIRAKLRGTP